MPSITHLPKGRAAIHSITTPRPEEGDMSDSSMEYNDETTIPNTSSENSMPLNNGEGRGRSPVIQNRSSINRDTDYLRRSYRPEPQQRVKGDIENEYSLPQCSKEEPRPRTKADSRYDYVPESAPVHQSSNMLSILVIIGLAITAVFIYSKLQSNVKICPYENLSIQYPQQDKKMWRTISIAIENILNKRSTAPAVHLFVHQGGNGMENLVTKIAKETSECFGGNFQLVKMSEDDFTSAQVVDDYGHAVDAFKKKIQNGRVAVIVNLNKIPPEAARALHTICDTITPIAEEIAIFLTLDTPIAKGNPVANAENTLEKLWGSKLERNELDALITRVTDQVLALKPLN